MQTLSTPFSLTPISARSALFAVILQYFRQRVASEMVQNNSKNKTVMTVYSAADNKHFA